MPTGYTAGILDGTTTTFKDYALLCARAFGATMHLRDKSMDAEYEPAVPSDYYLTALERSEEALEKYKSMTDEELIADAKVELERSLQSYRNMKQKAQEGADRLTEMLNQANAFVPPTKEHESLKEFMVDQLEKTIDFDGPSKWHDESISKLEKRLSSLDADVIRAEKVAKAHRDIARATENYQKELKRCADANKWVTDLINSI